MAHQTAASDLGVAGSRTFIAGTGALVTAAGIGLALMRYVGGSPPEQGFEGALGAFTLGAVIAMPGILALLALRGRPALLLPPAVVLCPLSFFSFSGLTLPLLIPATMLFIAYRRRSSDDGVGPGRAVGATAVVLGLLVVAVIALFANDDFRSYGSTSDGRTGGPVVTIERSDRGASVTVEGRGRAGSLVTAEGTGWTSDVITFSESVRSLALLGIAVAGAWVLTRPPSPRSAVRSALGGVAPVVRSGRRTTS